MEKTNIKSHKPCKILEYQSPDYIIPQTLHEGTQASKLSLKARLVKAIMS